MGPSSAPERTRPTPQHLTLLAEVRDQATPARRLPAVLDAYAMLTRHSHDTLAAQLHRGQHVPHAQRQLHHFVRDLIVEAAQVGRIRSDIDADELTHHCLHALGAATDLRSRSAVHRLVTVTLNGLAVPTSTSAT